MGIAGLGAGIAWVKEKGLETVRIHEVGLTRGPRRGLAGIAGVRLFGPDDPELTTVALSFTLAGKRVLGVGQRLDEEFGILCRVGLHCAPAAHRTIGSFREGTVRLAPRRVDDRSRNRSDGSGGGGDSKIMKRAVFLFHTTTSAIRAEKELKKAGLEVKLVPTPRELSERLRDRPANRGGTGGGRARACWPRQRWRRSCICWRKKEAPFLRGFFEFYRQLIRRVSLLLPSAVALPQSPRRCRAR